MFHIGVCDKCERFVAEADGQAWRLFFFHICRVVDFIHETYPQLSVIMWDDMFRQLDADALKGNTLGFSLKSLFHVLRFGVYVACVLSC